MKKAKFLSLVVLALFVITSCEKDTFDPPQTGTEEPENPEDPEDPEIPNETFDDVPILSIYSNGYEINDQSKVFSNFTLYENGEKTLEGHAGVKLRGASSLWFDKKQYTFETWDNNGVDIDMQFFHFPEEEDFVLNGPYADKSLMRNKLIYDLARDIDQVYAPRTKFIELVLNGSQKGVYVFTEKLKNDKGRLDLKKLGLLDNTSDVISGGYILSIDKGIDGGYNYNGTMSFDTRITPTHNPSADPYKFQYIYPKAEEITDPQRVYIQNYIHEFEAALAGDNFKDPENGYRKYIDVESFVDFMILNEITNNVDGYRLSTYMHKDRDGKLKMGPIWDFNLAFGNADYCSGGATDVWAYRINERCNSDVWYVPFWWDRLMEDPYFVSILKERYAAYRSNILSTGNMLDKLENYRTLLDDYNSIERNFTIWNVLGVYLWPNNYVGQTYDDEYLYLRNWISSRMSWLDGAIGGL